ncbi:MAG TPA: DUF5676 family membrane protein [Bacteroidia bacterium]|nr:DUF5676 family membrane protein [Bacteroidia bacterium]
MKITPSKFALALGIALSISFLLCNIIFAIGGKDFSLSIVNTIFHDMDFKPLMIDSGFNIGKLLCGMLILFLEGLFIGYVTAFIYNTLNKNKQ